MAVEKIGIHFGQYYNFHYLNAKSISVEDHNIEDILLKLLECMFEHRYTWYSKGSFFLKFSHLMVMVP